MKDIYQKTDNFETYCHINSKCVIKGSINNPVISIFIPTFKRYETIAETIKSAINQESEEVYEIVIVNNDCEGVDDETKRIIESFHDEKIYYYVNEENIGLCGNWNRGLELCRAQYVAMIHDDDILSPWFLDSMIHAIRKNGHATIIGVNSIDFDSNNMPHFRHPDKLKYSKVTKRSFFFGRYIFIAGMTVNRNQLIKLGGYTDEYYPNEDTILIYRALLDGEVRNVNNILAGYRKEVNLSLSKDTIRKMIEITEQTRRNIAKHETFAKIFMKLFDREYLYIYAEGANKVWNKNVNIDDIMKEFELPIGKPNTLKLLLTKAICKLGRI